MIISFPHGGAGPTDKKETISIRCPNCRQNGTFQDLGTNDLAASEPVISNARIAGTARLGQRRCPNEECACHIFFISHNKQILAIYPALTLDFDSTGVPSNVLSTLQEAITCHAHR